MMNKKEKILFWDIETSLITYGGFSLFQKGIDYRTIKEDFKILTGAWKFLGDKKVQSKQATILPGGQIDDMELVETLADLIEEADIIVGHNQDKFDIKKLRTRMLKLGSEPLVRNPTSIDTLKQVKKYFGMTSNRLDYLGIYLDVGRKAQHSTGLWLDVFHRYQYTNVKKALDALEKYNKGDIVLLEEVYKVLAPFIDHPIRDSGEVCSNPYCNSTSLQKRGFNITKGGTKYQRYQCMDCGKWMQNNCITKVKLK